MRDCDDPLAPDYVLPFTDVIDTALDDETLHMIARRHPDRFQTYRRAVVAKHTSEWQDVPGWSFDADALYTLADIERALEAHEAAGWEWEVYGGSATGRELRLRIRRPALAFVGAR